MKIAVSSDSRTNLTDAVAASLEERGHTLLRFGCFSDATQPETDWPLCTAFAAQAVADGRADEGVVFCFTGTGASIAANKVIGIRAALVHDAATAAGARVHNHANILVLSTRAVSEAIAEEILDAWFATPYSVDAWNKLQVKRVAQLEN